MVLLGRVCDPLHTSREKIEISQVFMEILGFKVLGKQGNVRDRLVAVNLLGKEC